MEAFQNGQFSGIGLNVLPSELAVFDIDKCRNPETGVILPEAIEAVRSLNSYAEISPSGTGLHGFGIGKGAELQRKQQFSNRCSIKSYRCCVRYITVTGLHLPNTPMHFADLDATMDNLVHRLDLNGRTPLWVKQLLENPGDDRWE